jgi:hypothetical protein
MNNLNFGLDSMSRAIRTGYDYSCNSGGDCTSGTGGYRFSFTAADNSDISYCLGSGNSCGSSTACPAGSSCSILRSVDGGTFLSLTAPEVAVSNLSFYLTGSTLGSPDNIQPKVIITLTGQVLLGSSQPTIFNIQTSVTQRLYDQ